MTTMENVNAEKIQMTCTMLGLEGPECTHIASEILSSNDWDVTKSIANYFCLPDSPCIKPLVPTSQGPSIKITSPKSESSECPKRGRDLRRKITSQKRKAALKNERKNLYYR